MHDGSARRALEVRRLILRCPLSPGDVVMLTAAVRDLHLSHPDAFQKRFTAEAATMFKRIFERLLEKGLAGARTPLPRRLRRFRDVLAVDSTAFPLHDKLAKHFRGYRSQGTKAMARVSATMGLADHCGTSNPVRRAQT